MNKPTLTQEYANLDKASRATDQYLKKRLCELTQVYEDIREMSIAKELENRQLEEEIKRLENEVRKKEDENQVIAMEEVAARPLRYIA